MELVNNPIGYLDIKFMPPEREPPSEQRIENLVSEVKRRLLDGTLLENKVEQMLAAVREREPGVVIPERATEQDPKVDTLPRVTADIKSYDEKVGTTVFIKDARGYYLGSIDMTLDALTTHDLQSEVKRLAAVLGVGVPDYCNLRLVLKDYILYHDLSTTKPALPPEFGLSGVVWVKIVLDEYVDLCQQLNYKPRLEKSVINDSTILWTVGAGMK